MINWNLLVLNGVIATLAGASTLLWGLTIRSVGQPRATVEFVCRLGVNRYFIGAMVIGLVMAVLTYGVLTSLGVMRGRFFLTTGAITTIVVAHLALGERLESIHYLGIGLVMTGALLLGRW